MRRVLYMAALASITWNPDLKAFYRQLISRGKPAKVAIVGCYQENVVHIKQHDTVPNTLGKKRNIVA